MAILVEVQCAYRTGTKANGGCRTLHGDDPQGRTQNEAKADAMKQGWVRLSKGFCCPPSLEFIS